MPGDPAGTPLDVVARRCPVCAAPGGAAIAARLDPARIDGFSFASRKVPEYMHWRLVACPACDTLYADPAPSQEALERAYARAHYDSAEAAGYAATTYATLLPRLLAETSAGGGALDIGAGDGAFLRELRRAGLRDVVGVEPSAAARDTAAAEVRDLIRPGRFRGEDFEPGRFRLITALQTLEHVAEPLALCRAAHGLLRDGGALAVVCHDRRAPLNRLLGRHSPIFDIEHLQLFSRRALRVLFERAGFERIEMHALRNRYPLRVWLRYVPLPRRLKEAALSSLPAGLAGLAVAVPAGNTAVIGYRPAPAPDGHHRDDAVNPPERRPVSPDPHTAPFEADIARTGAYAYTTDARLSSATANRRLTDAAMSVADFAGRRVIDVGCGDGTYTTELVRLGEAAQVTGVDPAGSAIRAARSRAADLPVTFVEASAYALPYGADSFDLAQLRGVLHHVERPRDVLREALRVAPRVVVIEPNGYNLGLKVLERVSAYHVEHDERSYAPRTLDGWIRELGASVEARTFAGFVPMFSPDRVARAMKRVEGLVEAVPLLRAAGCAVYVCTAVREPAAP